MTRARRLARPARLALLAACAGLTAAALPADPASAQGAGCVGAQPAGFCPYSAASQVGQRSGGVLRFPQAVAVAPDGTTYVADQGSHVVSVFGPDGVFRREIGTPGIRPGELDAVGALAIAGDGSLFVAEGALNRIDRFTPDGKLMRSFGGPGTDVGEFRLGGGRGNDGGAGGGLAAGGNFVFVADSANDRIQRFNLDGSGGRVVTPAVGVANPKGLAVRKQRLFIADDQNHRVLATDFNGRLLKSIGGAKGERPGQLNFPYGVALDGPGRLFVADNLNHRIVRFSTQPNYPYKGRWGSYGTQPGRLAFVRGLATDAAGRVYVANTGNDRIDVFTNGGQLVRSFGVSGRGTGQFNQPEGVTSDRQGFRAVTDANNGRVQFLDPAGKIVTVWGSPAPGPTILLRPVDVDFDAAGNAYVLDQRRARIFVFARGSGTPVRSIAVQGSGPGRLRDPSALAISPGGTIYVADTGNRRIARFSVAGQYLGAITDAGAVHGVALSPAGERLYSTSGNFVDIWSIPGSARLDRFGGLGKNLGKLVAPQHLTVDASGRVFVVDRGNARIQMYGPDGERLGMFGLRGGGAGQFIRPTGIDIDCGGRMTVTDTDNNRVQQFQLLDARAPACAALPPLGTPKAVKLPIGPIPDGPQLEVRSLRTRGLLAGKREIPVRVGCDTTCKVTVTVRLTPRATPRGKRKRVTVTATARAVRIRAGASRIVRTVISRSGAASLRRALRGQKGLSVTVQVNATADAGEPTTETQRFDGGA